MGDHIARGEDFEKKAEKKLSGWSFLGKLTDCYLKLDSKHEAANAYPNADAAHCYKKSTTRGFAESIACLEMSARYYKEIAELYEQEQNLEQAIVYYEKATDVTTSANQCKQKIAQFASQLEQYQKAIVIYEEIAQHSLTNNLLKYGVKGHLLNVGICQLCKGDVISINNALEKYQDLDPTFSGTWEYKLLKDLAVALDEEDRFTHVCVWK